MKLSAAAETIRVHELMLICTLALLLLAVTIHIVLPLESSRHMQNAVVALMLLLMK